MPVPLNGTKSLTNGHPSSWQAKHDLPSHFIGGSYLDNAPAGKVKDFVQSHDGHSVITSVSRHWNIESCQLGLTFAFRRFLLPTTVLQQSKKSDLSENGPTKFSAMNEQFNLLSWLRPKIFKRTQTTFVWRTNMLRYGRTRSLARIAVASREET